MPGSGVGSGVGVGVGVGAGVSVPPLSVLPESVVPVLPLPPVPPVPPVSPFVSVALSWLPASSVDVSSVVAAVPSFAEDAVF